MDLKTLTLVRPTKAHETMCKDFIQTVLNHDGLFQGTSGIDTMPFYKWVHHVSDASQGKNLPDNYVSATTLLAITNDTLLGFINIRHHLNPFLLEAGGHIGYMVDPRYRRKGVATMMLAKALEFCRVHLNIDRILITCDPDNIGSKNTIINNGGVYENTVDSDALGTVERYWISLR